MKRISRSAIVEHRAEEMYALVDDIESYPRFLPWCVAARVEERTATAVQATLTIGLRGLRTHRQRQRHRRMPTMYSPGLST